MRTCYTVSLATSKDIHLEPVVRPAPELHLAVLVVEGEPRDVDLAGGLEDAWGNVVAATVAGDYHIGGVSAVDRKLSNCQFVSTICK